MTGIRDSMKAIVIGKEDHNVDHMPILFRRGLKRLLPLVLGFVVLTLSAHPSAAQSTASDPLKYLEEQVAAGRLDKSVLAEIRTGPNGASAVLLYEDHEALLAAQQRLDARNLQIADQQSLAEKANAYAALKQKVTGNVGGVRVVQDYRHFGVQYVHVADAKTLAAVLQRPEVRAVRENAVHEHMTGESLGLIGQPAAVAAGATGRGTAVAVLDSGVDYRRTAFGSCMAPGTPATCKVAVARDFAPEDSLLDDSILHGTNVAGIVVGVAPQAKILALDVFDGAVARSTDILAALTWVLDTRDTYNTVAVNMSFSRRGTYFTTPCASSYATSAFANLNMAGILPVVATGNFGSALGIFQNGIAAPACTPGAVSVGAVYDANVGSRSWDPDGDSRIDCTDSATAADKITCFSQSGPILTLLAPGSRITAAGVTMSGTSQAAPHVAGAIAAIDSMCGWRVDDAFLQEHGRPITDTRNGISRPRLDLGAAAEDMSIRCALRSILRWPRYPVYDIVVRF